MPQVLITESKLDNLAQQVSNKAGIALPLTIDEMAAAVANISTETPLNLQSKTVTPTSSGITVTSDTGYDGLSSVSVEGDSDLVANNIKHGVNIFGTSGTFGTKIDSIMVTPAKGQTITFTGLKAQPLAFSCTIEDQGTVASARTIYSVIYNGQKVYNLTSYRSGSSLLFYKYETCTYTYSNGTLTITSPSSSINGVFQALEHRLMYVYEE